MPGIEGYTVVPLRVTPNTQNYHCVYMREHFIRLMDPNKPKGRTLFILNVPPYVTEQSLKIFFDKIGDVEMVHFAEKPGREETYEWQQNVALFSSAQPPFKFKVAYIIFKTNTSLEKALLVTSIDLFTPATKESFIESGMQLWHNQYESRILNEEDTQKLIDDYMLEYDERELKAHEAAKNSEPDADGWVTVGKEGRNAGFEQKESVIGRLEGKIARDKKSKELTNFYTFQIRESKMKNIIDLRKKFEEDKRKIENLKQTRRFRPF